MHTDAGLLTDKQADRLTTLFAEQEHVEVEATLGSANGWSPPTGSPTAPRAANGWRKLIASVSKDVPKTLTEIITLGRTLKKRAADVLAHFDRPRTSTGPTRPSTAGCNTSAAPPSASAT